ncbi:MAG: 3-deoxy-manno-octulosonate cytidylyltransferase [Cyclobacteriaceae bacterium]|nr:3-deoxy-manno-octulosonate cytidylyltransferase [Cyclobacteriaceae bacterium]
MSNILGIIPARYASTRFPAKALIEVAGKSMIQRVYDQAKKASSLAEVVVATDHREIFNHVNQFGGKVCMTSDSHISGTDRCYEALSLQKESFDYVINIQGDEPFIHPDQINLLTTCLTGDTEIATLAKQIEDHEQLENVNVVKVVFSLSNQALLFSRSPIPYLRNIPKKDWLSAYTFYKHIGMYAYRSDVLRKLTELPVSSLEKAEALEQLRWLENGFIIKVIETKQETIGIDTPDDLQKALAFLKNQ